MKPVCLPLIDGVVLFGFDEIPPQLDPHEGLCVVDRAVGNWFMINPMLKEINRDERQCSLKK